MGIAKKTDGRYVVGVGVDNANDYKGSAAYRDIYIQLTSSGATEKSEEYLTFLKDYAVNANALGEPIMPPSVNVWISNNGVTTAVEADDVSIDGNNYTICGIKWNGSTWDYSGAGQGKSGSGLPSYTSADKGRVLTIGDASPVETEVVVIPEQSVTVSSGAVSVLSAGTLQNGDRCTLIVNGDLYEAIAEPQIPTSEIGIKILDGNNMVLYQVSASQFYAANAGTYTISLSAVQFVTPSVPSVEPKWEAVGGYIYTASSTFQSGIMGLLQTAVTDMATNNKTFASADGVILSDEDAAAVAEMGTNPARERILRAINQDFAVVRSDGESITVVLPYYEKAISTQLTYYLSMSFTLGALSKRCFVRVTLLGHS